MKEQNNSEHKLFIQYLPRKPLAQFIASKISDDLSVEGKQALQNVIGRVLGGEPVQVSQEAGLVLQDSKSHINIFGADNIPTSGPALFIGNHVKGGPLDGMGQFFEMARVVYERMGVEPFLVMQRGLTGWNPFKRFFSGQVYTLAGRSFKNEVVDPPKIKKGQITNNQQLSPRAIKRVVRGEPMFLFPQGQNCEPGNFHFPDKTDELFALLSKLDRQHKLQVIGVASTPMGPDLDIYFGRACYLSEIINNSAATTPSQFVFDSIYF